MRKLGSGCLTLVLSAALCFGWGMVGYALVAGDYETPHRGPVRGISGVQRFLATAWLLSPVAVALVAVFVLVRRRHASEP